MIGTTAMRDSTTLAGLALLLLAAAAPGQPAAAQDTAVVESPAQGSIGLTIYNDGLALVADRRTVKLPRGSSRIAVEQVSTAMQPETVLVEADRDGPPLAIRSRSFNFDLLTPEALLQRAVGGTVRVVQVNPATGQEKVEQAEVLSAANGVVLKIGDRIETGIPGRLVFDSLPPGLTERPTLYVAVDSDTARDATFDLRYLTGGLSWRADYVAALAPDAKTLDFSGFATMTNTSGVAYRDAAVRLVAGSVNREAQPMPRAAPAMAVMKMSDEAGSGPAPQPVGDLHLYPLAGRLTLEQRETRQQALVGPVRVPVVRTYRIEGGGAHLGRQDQPIDQNAAIRLTIVNDKASGLGVPLPRGTVRVYGAADGGPVFMGEDGIDHNAAGEEVKLNIGQAFDITATRRQTDFRSEGLPKRVLESAHAIELRNAKAEPVEVIVSESIPGDWTMLQESQKHEKPTSGTARWTVQVPANGKTELTYRVRVQM